MTRPLITLLTDFGTSDHYVAAMKGVILGICPEANIKDITHEIPPFSVIEGSFAISQAWKTFPAGTIHVAVVDPGVGTERRALAAELNSHIFIVPDNGLLTLLPGNLSVRNIAAEEHFRHPVSRTFHGRDVFAPAAAQMSRGVSIESLGPEVDNWVRLEISNPQQGIGTILKADRFGNLITNIPTGTEVAEIDMGGVRISRFHRSYAEASPGEPFLIDGSAGFVEVSIRQGSAAAVTGSGSGDRFQFRLA